VKQLGEGPPDGKASEILEYVAGPSLQVIQSRRPKLACAVCDRIVQVPHRAGTT